MSPSLSPIQTTGPLRSGSCPPVVTGPAESDLVTVGAGGRMRVIVPGAATGNAYAVYLGSYEPGSGSLRQVHTREEKVFHVLDGRVLVWCDGRATEAGPGDTLALPRGLPHAFRVISDTPARMIMTVVPGGFETFFAAIAGLRLPDDQARLVTISERYGLEYVGPPL